MKKVTLLLVGFFCSLTMFAGEITKEQAMEKARQVLKGKQLIMQTTHRRASSSRAELIPLMNTQWDQTGIYQAQCPEIDGQKTLTGCVATAMAQVINFFQWPLNNVREAVGYTSEDALKKMELPSLPARQFNWFNMSNDDIAWLMRYCGQAVIMKYGVTESTAYSSAIPGALISVFNFSKGVDEMVREEFTDDEWEDVIYKEKLSVVALLIDKADGRIVNAAQFKFYQDDESGETAISDAVRQNNPSQTMNDYWYTIDGRRLTAKPTRQGLYIQGGQKRIVK